MSDNNNYYDDSMRMDDVENNVYEKIKEACSGCEAWGGDDCTRNPIT